MVLATRLLEAALTDGALFPSGSAGANLPMLAARVALSTNSSDTSGRPRRMLSLTGRDVMVGPW